MESVSFEYLSNHQIQIPKCHQANINKSTKSRQFIQLGNLRINILPIYTDQKHNTVASLKFACDNDDMFRVLKSPLENLKLNKNSHSKILQSSRVRRFSSTSKSEFATKLPGTEVKVRSNPAINKEEQTSGKLKISNHLIYRSPIKGNIFCRNRTYPKSEIDRFHVPDDKVSFATSYLEYETKYLPFCSNKNGLIITLRADQVNQNLMELAYNEAIENKLKNPIGRTGVIGKGFLEKYGKNRYAFIVITKLKRKSNGEIVFRKNSDIPEYQFLSLQYTEFDNTWGIPAGTKDNNNNYYLIGVSKSHLELNLLQKEKLILLKAIYDEVFRNQYMVYDGYLDDYFNTDDAWIEAIAYNYHHERDDIVKKVNEAIVDSKMNPENLKFKWTDFDNEENLYLPHKNILYLTEHYLNTQWISKKIN